MSEGLLNLGTEQHAGLGSKLGDIILGGQDGLVNTLGVVLGVSAATSDLRIIIAGGLAAAFAESISMAAVAYTSTLADLDFYRSQVERERREIREVPQLEEQEVRTIFQRWGFEGSLLEQIVEHIKNHEEHWVDIMMAHELQLQPINEKGVLAASLLVGFSAIVGSLIPLLPFFLIPTTYAPIAAVLITALTLFGVGAIKARITVGHPIRSGVQMLLIGTLSALAGYAIGAFFGAR